MDTDLDFGSTFRGQAGKATFDAAIVLTAVDKPLRVAIVTGAGKALSSSGNLKLMKHRQGTFAGNAISVKDECRLGIKRVAHAMWECQVALLNAVNGRASHSADRSRSQFPWRWQRRGKAIRFSTIAIDRECRSH